MTTATYSFASVRPFSSWIRRLSTGLLFVVLLTPLAGSAQQLVNQVTTEHNDIGRTGQNTSETILTPANVNSLTFGKLFSYPVDGYIYAQPLYVPNVSIPGKGVHNVVFVVTEHDSVYAFDADRDARGLGGPLWKTSFIDPGNGITTISVSDINCQAISPEVGITSTPVIDTKTNTIYVLAETKEHGNFFHRLHALDIRTGVEKNGGPVTISGSVPGTGTGSSGGILTFNPLMHLNRPGLLLLTSGNIVIGWSSNCDLSPYHGWVMAYNKTTLEQKGIWASTPNAYNGGIWMSGSGIAADAAGSIFLATGNGKFDTSGNPVNMGDSILRMALTSSGLGVYDYFTPYDQATLNNGDKDVGSGGVLLTPQQSGPHPYEVIGAGKEGTIYVLDRGRLGHYNSTDNSQIVQSIPGQIGGLFSGPAYWNGNLYFGGYNDTLKAFSLTDGLLSTAPTSQTSVHFKFPGTAPTVSSNQNDDGIVWTLETNAGINNGNEILYAFDATDLSHELYDSTQNGSQDNAGGAVKFVSPTVVNGKVYVGSAQQLSVYGNVTPIAAAPTFSPAWGTYTSAQTVTISDSTPGAVIYYTLDGSTPTQSSPVYTAPLTVSSTTTIKTMASAPRYANSMIVTSVYTITTSGGGALDYSTGFTSTGMDLNGASTISGSRLRLTSGGTGQTSSAWYPTPVNVQAFSQDFSFQMANAAGDGMTFTIQKAGTTAIGPGGAGLGYGAATIGGTGGIPTSVAVKFDLYNNFGEGQNSTGVYIRGASPTIPAQNMGNGGINLHSGDIFHVHMNYDGTTLTMTITDTFTYNTYTQSWAIDIPKAVGGTSAYIGFTGSSGGVTAVQDILNWTFASPTAVNYGSGFTSTGLAFNRAASLNGTRARLTDGGLGEIASVWFTAPVNVQTFTQDFTLQLTNPRADGMTFAIQNAGITATGPGGAGLGYGQPTPGQGHGIPTSVAVKFDLYNNAGEGPNSTGLYVNGASPTLPAIDMTSSGVSLHSGDVLSVHMTYDGTTLSLQITDKTINKMFQTSWPIDIPGTVGGNTAYIGFTAGTGGASSTQEVLTWTYTP